MENLKKWATSGVGITLAFIMFWPLGFVLLYLRFFYNGGILRARANLYRGLAIFCYFCAMCILIALTEATEENFQSTLIIMVIFLVAGIVATIPTCKEIKKYKYYKKYADYMIVKRNVTIEELAQKMGRNIETVTEDVAKVFEYKMMRGYINEDNEIITVRKDENQSNYIIPEKKQVVTLKCKNCGATNRFVEGKENRCEYCDSLLIHN